MNFQGTAQEIGDRIESRLETHLVILRTGAGLFAASEEVTRNEFTRYVAQMELRTHFPGIQGYGFTKWLLAAEKPAFQAAMRKQGFQGFHIWPETPPRQVYTSITFLEPLDWRNQRAIGYDMFSEAIRREAMERARDSSMAAASGRVTLVQETSTSQQAGVLLSLPVYEGGTVPQNQEQRRRKIDGFIYSPVRADDLFAGILGLGHRPGVAFCVYDGKPEPTALLHSSPNMANVSKHPRLQREQNLVFGGRPWLIQFFSTRQFERASNRKVIPVIALMGVFVSIALFAVTRSQSQARARAETLAQTLTDITRRLAQIGDSYPGVARAISIWDSDICP